jgi:hypothetical protein
MQTLARGEIVGAGDAMRGADPVRQRDVIRRRSDLAMKSIEWSRLPTRGSNARSPSAVDVRLRIA